MTLQVYPFLSSPNYSDHNSNRATRTIFTFPEWLVLSLFTEEKKEGLHSTCTLPIIPKTFSPQHQQNQLNQLHISVVFTAEKASVPHLRQKQQKGRWEMVRFTAQSPQTRKHICNEMLVFDQSPCHATN